MRIAVENPQEVVKEAVWLAWQACGGPLGMGVFQNRPGATKEDVWRCLYERGDYPGGNQFAGNVTNKPGKIYGDYVFGRMMKLWLEWDDVNVTVPDAAPRADYQAWCVRYPTYADLIAAAAHNLAGKGAATQKS